MSSNTKIYLSNHAKTEEVFKVILKIVGTEFKQSEIGIGKKFNKNNPSSEENRWTLKPVKKQKNEIKLASTTYFNFYFEDCIGNLQSSMYFFEGYENEYSVNNEKIMNPDSTPLWGAIGKRLVDFFGGKVLFTDSSDSDNPNNWHVCDTPKYPKRTKNESINEQWYKFQNALFNEPMIKAQEIKDMKNKTRYWDEDTTNLVSYLERYESAQELAGSLSNKRKESKTNKKLKV